MAADRPLAELADRVRAGYNRLLYRGTLAERRELLDRCTSFDRAGLLATPVKDARFVMMDTETTGLSAYAGDEIVQVALLEYRGLDPTGEEYVSLVQPPRSIPPESTAFHGIDDEMVAEAPAIDDIIDEIVDFIGPAVIVGHHAAFDLRFLNRVMHRCLFCRLPQPTIDTMLLYLAFGGRFGHYGLDEVAAACGVSADHRHNAQADAATCGAIFAHIVPHLTGPDATVAELLAAARASDNRDDDSAQPSV